jgi:hypothetical protein
MQKLTLRDCVAGAAIFDPEDDPLVSKERVEATRRVAEGSLARRCAVDGNYQLAINAVIQGY